jgi:hypothetical protein
VPIFIVLGPPSLHSVPFALIQGYTISARLSLIERSFAPLNSFER